MPQCALCQGHERLYKCFYCGKWYCETCIFKQTTPFRWSCSQMNDHLLQRTLIREEVMATYSLQDALRQGRDKAKVLRANFIVNPEVTYRDSRTLGAQYANEAGLNNNAELWNAYVEGFADTWMMTEAELKTAFTAGKISVEQLGQQIAKLMIEGPK